MAGKGDTSLSSLIIQRLEESASITASLCDQADDILRITEVLLGALRAGNKILFCGNGGSGADAQHLAAELVGEIARDRTALPSMALTADTAIITAVANDYGYEHVFARQVSAYGQPGDVLVGMSTSGRSLNVLAAFEEARRRGITTVAFTGPTGQAKDVADHALVVASTNTAGVQEAHITLGHIICEFIELEIFGS